MMTLGAGYETINHGKGKKMKRITKSIITFTAGVATALTVGWARGETILGHEESCALLARNAQVAANYRDAGEPWEKISESARSSFTASLGQEKALAKDEDDIEIILGTIEFIYANPTMTPDVALEYTYAACARAGRGRKRAVL